MHGLIDISQHVVHREDVALCYWSTADSDKLTKSGDSSAVTDPRIHLSRHSHGCTRGNPKQWSLTVGGASWGASWAGR